MQGGFGLRAPSPCGIDQPLHDAVDTARLIAKDGRLDRLNVMRDLFGSLDTAIWYTGWRKAPNWYEIGSRHGNHTGVDYVCSQRTYRLGKAPASSSN